MVENRKEELTTSASNFINALVLNGVISAEDTDIQALEYPEIIHKVAKHIKGTSINDFAEVIINTRNARYISTFATCIEGAPIEKLMFGVVASYAPVLDKLIYLYGMKERIIGTEEEKKQIYDKVLDAFVNMTIAEGNLTSLECLYSYAPSDEVKERLRSAIGNMKAISKAKREMFNYMKKS